MYSLRPVRFLYSALFTPTLAMLLLHLAETHANPLVSESVGDRLQAQDERRAIANERVSAINRLWSEEKIAWTAAYNERFALMHPDERSRMQGAFKSASGSPSIAEESADTPDYNDGSDEAEDLPVRFDVREAWPECAAFAGNISDQSYCGSCWAIATAAVATDRNCIAASRAGHTLNASRVSNWASAEDILTCAPGNFGCYGGYVEKAFDYANTSGVMTGSPAYTNTSGPEAGCKPYPFPPAADSTQHDYATPECTKSNCTNDNSTDTTRIRLSSYTQLTTTPNTSLERDIMTELQANGSVTAVMVVYYDLFYYDSGVYTNTTTHAAGRHAVRIIGWGVAGTEQQNISYWLVANSWGSDWGEAGFFRIRRGTNVCDIESDIIF